MHPHTPRVLKQTYNYTQTRRPHPWRNHRDHSWCHRRRARHSPSVAPRVRGCSSDSCRRDNKGAWRRAFGHWAHGARRCLRLLRVAHYKKCGDLWRKFHDVLKRRHNRTQSMTIFKFLSWIWRYGPLAQNLVMFNWIHHNQAHKIIMFQY